MRVEARSTFLFQCLKEQSLKVRSSCIPINYELSTINSLVGRAFAATAADRAALGR